jgi:transcriptional regulator with XRE-family HTH domain
MTTPNAALRAARTAHHWSQDELARALRNWGEHVGEPNGCDKRQVQRWEAGEVATPRGNYARALEAVLGQPLVNLGFADETYGIDREQAMNVTDMTAIPGPAGKTAPAGPLAGIWRSRYEYESSSRGNRWFYSQHYGLLLHRGIFLQFRSFPGTADGRIVMDMDLNGAAVTGKWTEQTDQDGHYRGSLYHGAIQMLVDPTLHRMEGKWVGFGRDYDVNVGAWRLDLVTSDTTPGSQQEYDRPVEREAGGPRGEVAA